MNAENKRRQDAERAGLARRPSSSWRLLLLALSLLCLGLPAGRAAPKDAVGLSKISLPSGPGSIEGLGDSFEPQLNSGTAAYSIKIASPPGVNGLQPGVVLRYNGGTGNGHFGLGWSDGLMCLQRQTEKGLPTYGPFDVFTFQGEELVPLADGTYRTENESGFMRFRRRDDGWEVTDKSGRRHLLGTVADARIHHQGGSTFMDTFKWCVNEVIDTHGNRMEYHYTAFPDSPGDIFCTAIRYSLSRDNPGVHHAIVFDYELRPDAFASFLSGFEIRCARRCREIRVESQGALVRRYKLSYAPDPGDPVENIAPSDAGLVFSLLRKVTQFDNGTTASPSFLPPLRLGYTRFAAADGSYGVVGNHPPFSLADPNIALIDLNGDSLPDLLRTDPLTSAHAVFYNLGRPLDGRGIGGIVFGPEIPFIAAPSATTLDTPGTELADYDGDGHVDLVQKFGGSFDRFVYFPNTTLPRDADESRPAWGTERSFAGPYPPFDLGDPTVRTLDLNGDKRIDFFRTTPWGFIYYYNRGTWWEEDGLRLFGDSGMGDITAADDVGFSKSGPAGGEVPNELVKLADMNGDRLLDLVRITEAGTLLDIVFWPNKGRGAWGTRQAMTGTLNLGVAPIEDVLVMDLNGDGLADVVTVTYDTLTFWVNQGNSTFSPPFTAVGTPSYIRGQTVLRQADINGNGSTDLLWENWDPTSGGYKLEYFDFTPVKPNLLRVIDNGIGLRTVIEYRTTTDSYIEARAGGNPWHTRLPFPSTVVSRITKHIGLDLDGATGNDNYITEFTYFDGYYDGFEKEFRGFAFAKKVERGDDNPALNPAPGAVHSPTTVSRFAFHTGVPDAIDNNGDGAFDEANELSGYEEEPLKGKVLWTEITLPTADVGGALAAQVDGEPADDAVVFSREYNDWRIKTIHSPTNGFDYVDAFGSAVGSASIPFPTADGKRVSFPFVARHTKAIIEANGTLAGHLAGFPLPLGGGEGQGEGVLVPSASRKTLYTERDVDYFGNPAIERNYGENSPGSTCDDERFSHSTYAFNLDAWLLGLPARQLITDENAVFVAESRNYYDGADFIGLPLGQVGLLGDRMREEHFINGPTLPPAFGTITTQVGDPRAPANASIVSVRNRYDPFGNLVVTRDPLYAGADQGHEKEYAYDAIFHTYVERETIRVGNGSADLVAQAAYDTGAGVMTGFTDFNGNGTAFQYDSFWRLVGIVKPGDTAALPTAVFSYRPADPFRHLSYDYTAGGQLSLMPTAESDLANAVTTRQREQADTANTFDTVSFTDGAGHKLGTLHESDVPGQWIAKDFKRHSSQGEERLAFLPFTTASPAYAVPPETISHVASFYDSASRVARTVNPPETTNANATVTETRTVYLPLETLLFDEEDINPASAYYNTPHVQLKDGLDRLTGVIEVTRLNDDGTPAGGTNHWLTRYEYDLNDNLTHITDSQGNQKWFRYDGLKRKLFMNDPDRGVMTYTYDDASNLRSTLDAKAQAITYTYDGVNRLLTEDYLDAAGHTPDVHYFYDTPLPNVPVGDGSTATARNAKGMLVYVQDLSGEEHTSYDARGRVEFVIKRLPDPQFLSYPLPSDGRGVGGEGLLVSYRTAFAYDSLDRVTTLTYADSDQVTYLYSARNLLQRITGGPSGSIISNIVYRPSDQLARIDYGNNVRTTYDYDSRLRLNSLATLAHPMGEGLGVRELLNFHYDFDGASNIRSITDRRPASVVPAGHARRNTQLFQYDDLYRIIRAQYSFALPGVITDNGHIQYRYDRIGNMLAQISSITDTEKGLPVANLGTMDSGGPAGRSNRTGRQPTDSPGPHALTKIRDPRPQTPDRNFSYDANGNMLVIDGLTNTWDFKDRLIKVEDTNMVAHYTYDYTDRRVMKRVRPKNPRPASGHPLPSDGRGAGGEGSVLYPDKYFEVREHDAPVKYIWNGNTRVARAVGNLNTTLRTQRLRLWPGHNLVSLAVSGSPRPLGGGEGAGVRGAFKWNQPTLTWQSVTPGEVVPAGTVLWLDASTNTTLTLTGHYIEPTNRPLAAGVNFLPGAGLEPLDLLSTLNPQLSTSWWLFDPLNATWLQRLTGDLQTVSNAPPMLPPGEGFFARADAPGELTVPDVALRLRYYHQDHLGSSSVLTDDDGQLVEETANYPFGHPRYEFRPRALREPYQFTQKEKDIESGLHYFETRFHSSSTARMVQPDRILKAVPPAALRDPQMHSSYSYARNNPVRFRDSTGQWIESAWDAFSLTISVIDFVKEPTLANGTAVVLDLGALLLPVPGGAGVARRATKEGLGIAKDTVKDVGDGQSLGRALKNSGEKWIAGKAVEKGVGRILHGRVSQNLERSGIKDRNISQKVHESADATAFLLGRGTEQAVEKVQKLGQREQSTSKSEESRSVGLDFSNTPTVDYPINRGVISVPAAGAEPRPEPNPQQ